MSSVQRVQVDETGAALAHNARVRGVQLVSGTSVTFYEGGSASGDPICVAVSAGTIQELPGCGVDAQDGVWGVVAGSGVAILYYD